MHPGSSVDPQVYIPRTHVRVSLAREHCDGVVERVPTYSLRGDLCTPSPTRPSMTTTLEWRDRNPPSRDVDPTDGPLQERKHRRKCRRRSLFGDAHVSLTHVGTLPDPGERV